MVDENPFTLPLQPEDGAPGTLRRNGRPYRLDVAARSCAPLGRTLLLLNLAWVGLALLVLLVVGLEEMGQPVAGVGTAAVILVGWIAQISPYHVPLFGLACLNAGAVCVGMMHVFTVQSYSWARLGAVACCLPLIGPWLGLTAPLGWMLLARLRRRAVRQAFLG